MISAEILMAIGLLCATPGITKDAQALKNACQSGLILCVNAKRVEALRTQSTYEMSELLATCELGRTRK